MKKLKHFFALFFCTLYFNVSKACDICGCGIGGSYIGIVPQFNNHFLGIRYRTQVFTHKDVPYSTLGNSKVIKDVYQTAELWGRYNFSPRLQVFYGIPFVFNKRLDQVRTNLIQGIGDINLSMNYIFYNSGDSVSKNYKVLVYTGTTVKLPSGKYQVRNADKLMHPIGLQPGTGAWSNALNFGGVLRYKRLGLSSEMRYVINHTNELGFKQGNQLLADINLFYWQKFGFNSIMLSGGTTLEHFNKDASFKIINNLSGGNAAYLNVGTDVFYRSIMCGLRLSIPMREEINSNLPTAGHRIGLHLNYFY
jgi:hypothetical protein